MTLYAYCVRRAGDPAPEAGLRGVDGGEVFAGERDGLGVWLSAVEAPPAPDRERVEAHDRVVRAALRTATPLPLRFGAVFVDEAAALDALAGRAEGLLAGLERVAGRVEMSVAALWDAAAERESLLAERPELRPAEGRPAGGRAYLEGKRRQRALEEALRARAEAVLDRVARRLAPAAGPAEEARSVLPRPDVAGTVAHLVRREESLAYREAAMAAGRGLPGVELRVSGPWAPYSFA
ncbi:MAG TPA: GvpL/GvpF family gas vesicle protein [Longimicrobiaceae bacterium]